MALFRQGKLQIGHSGHPLHSLAVSAAQMEAGEAVYDVWQAVDLDAVKVRGGQPPACSRHVAAKFKRPTCRTQERPSRETLQPGQGRHLRIEHTRAQLAHRLPAAFTANSPLEQRLLEHAAAYREAWAGAHPGQLPPCVSLLNEAGCQKAVCTTLRPTLLPHTQLYDLAGVAQFVAEFFTYEPLLQPHRWGRKAGTKGWQEAAARPV